MTGNTERNMLIVNLLNGMIEELMEEMQQLEPTVERYNLLGVQIGVLKKVCMEFGGKEARHD